MPMLRRCDVRVGEALTKERKSSAAWRDGWELMVRWRSSSLRENRGAAAEGAMEVAGRSSEIRSWVGGIGRRRRVAEQRAAGGVWGIDERRNGAAALAPSGTAGADWLGRRLNARDEHQNSDKPNMAATT